MRTIIVDCSEAKSETEFWQRYVDAAQPNAANLFGRNLDAFWDAIEGGGPGWPGKVRLVFRHSNELAAVDSRREVSLLEGLRRIANEATFMEIRLE